MGIAAVILITICILGVFLGPDDSNAVPCLSLGAVGIILGIAEIVQWALL